MRILNALSLAGVALTLASCRLISGDVACDSNADCFADESCVDSVCTAEGEGEEGEGDIVGEGEGDIVVGEGEGDVVVGEGEGEVDACGGTCGVGQSCVNAECCNDGDHDLVCDVDDIAPADAASIDVDADRNGASDAWTEFTMPFDVCRVALTPFDPVLLIDFDGRSAFWNASTGAIISDLGTGPTFSSCPDEVFLLGNRIVGVKNSPDFRTPAIAEAAACDAPAACGEPVAIDGLGNRANTALAVVQGPATYLAAVGGRTEVNLNAVILDEVRRLERDAGTAFVLEPTALAEGLFNGKAFDFNGTGVLVVDAQVDGGFADPFLRLADGASLPKKPGDVAAANRVAAARPLRLFNGVMTMDLDGHADFYKREGPAVAITHADAGLPAPLAGSAMIASRNRVMRVAGDSSECLMVGLVGETAGAPPTLRTFRCPALPRDVITAGVFTVETLEFTVVVNLAAGERSHLFRYAPR